MGSVSSGFTSQSPKQTTTQLTGGWITGFVFKAWANYGILKDAAGPACVLGFTCIHRGKGSTRCPGFVFVN